MFYCIVEEVRMQATWENDRKLLRGPLRIDVKLSAEDADDRAKELVSKFDHCGLNEEGDGRHSYWWGRNDNAKEVVRYKVVRV